MSKKNVHLFVPLMKVDVENRLLIGTMTQEVEDRMGEVMDYDTSKAYFIKWSESIAKATGGKSVGNLRIMHGLAVAGIVKSMEFDDEARKIDIVAEVIDEDTWQMVLKGGYTGFSIGGRYVRKFREGQVQKFTVDPYEVSVVDYPCVPTATFEVIKADGATEAVSFKLWEPSNEELVAKATEIADGKGGAWNQYLADARDLLIKARMPEDEGGEEAEDETAEKSADEGEVEKAEGEDDAEKATTEETSKEQAEEEAEDEKDELVKSVVPARQRLAQVWKTSDGQTFPTVAAAVSHEESLDTASITEPLTKALSEAQKALKAEDGEKAESQANPALIVADDLDLWKGLLDEAHKKWDDNLVAKSMYSVSRLAEMMDGMSCLIRCQLWDKADELATGNERGNGQINELYGILKTMGDTLVKMAKEEIAEMIAELNQRGVPIGSDLSGQIIELTVSDTLAKARGQEVPVRKVFAIADIAKALGLMTDGEELAKVTAERDTLKKTIEDTTTAVNSMKADIEELKKTAMPSKVITTHAVSKEDDDGGNVQKAITTSKSLEDFIEGASPDDLAKAAIKIAQRNPQRMGTR